MQLAGREKRIQALFSELSHEDQSITPRFEKLWNRAESVNPKPVRLLRQSVAMIAAGLAVVALFSLALWSRSRPVETIHSAHNKTETLSTPVEPNILSKGAKKQKRVIRQRKFKRAVTNEAIALSRWQSPTEILLTSSSIAILGTSPKLNQSVKELESFLPSEVKETKQ